MIPLFEPNLDLKEKKNLINCINSNWISSKGSFVKKFEKKIQSLTKSNYVVACQSGSTALFLSLKIIGANNKTEVIVPSITYISPVNAIIHNNSFPIFMDCDENNNLDINKVLLFLKKKTFFKHGKTFNKKTKRQIIAIVIPHLLGSAVNFHNLKKIFKKNNIFIIEDAAEAFGVFLKSKNNSSNHVGTNGDIGCLSFNANKLVTAAGGGAILTSSKKIAKKFYYLINQAKDNEEFFIHNEPGYNLGLSNVHAAIGLAQTEKLKLFLKKKRKIFNNYKKLLKKTKNFELINPENKVKSNFWLTVIKSRKKINLRKLVKFMKSHKIQTRMLWYPNHLQKHMRNYERFSLNQSIKNYQSHLCLPSSVNLNRDKINKICNTLSKFEKKFT